MAHIPFKQLEERYGLKLVSSIGNTERFIKYGYESTSFVEVYFYDNKVVSISLRDDKSSITLEVANRYIIENDDEFKWLLCRGRAAQYFL